MILWAALVSFVSGLSAAYRKTININDLLRSAMNTAMMGGCLAAVASYFVLDKPALAWAVIGIVGLLSLGGLGIVDWAVSLAKSKVENKVKE